MALSTIIQTSRHGTVSVIDGSGTPKVLAVRFDKGDFSLSGLSADMCEIITFAARHVHIGHAKGAPTYPTGSFSLFITDYAGPTATDGTLQDMIHGTTGTLFAGRVSVASNYDGIAFDIRWDADTDEDGTTDNTMTMHGCVITGYDMSEADDGTTMTVNFTCYGDGTNYVSGDITVPMAS